MGGVVWVNWTLNPNIPNTERKRPVHKVIVAKWQALATSKHFIDNYKSGHEPHVLPFGCKHSM